MKKLGLLLLFLAHSCAQTPVFADQIDTKFIKDNAVTSPKILLGNNTPLRGRNAANTADFSLLLVDGSDNVTVGDPTVALIGIGLTNTMASANVTGQTSGGISIFSGTSDQATGDISVSSNNATTTFTSGGVSISTGSTAAGKSGTIFLSTGNSSADDTGDIQLLTGSPAGNRGHIVFQDGSQGTAGWVWTSIDTAGTGAWVANSGGGANTSLSNLVPPTQINADLIFAVTSTEHQVRTDSSSGNTDNIRFKSGDSSGGASGSIYFNSGAANSGSKSGDVIISSGPQQDNTNDSGGVQILSADNGSTFNSGNILFQSGVSVDGSTGAILQNTGNSSGAGNTGGINIDSGVASGTGNTGALNIGSGTSTGTGGTGSLNLTTGSVNTGSSGSGLINISTGSTDAAFSGAIQIISGSSNSNNSGDLDLLTGNASGAANSGKIILKTGDTDTGTPNTIQLTGGSTLSTGTGGSVALLGGDSGSSGSGGGVSIVSGATGSGTGGLISIHTQNLSGAAVPGNITMGTGFNNNTSGDVIIDNGHIRIDSALSSPAVSSCGTSPSLAGNDVLGRVTVDTGGAGVTSCTVTFTQPFATTPMCFVSNETDIVATQVVPSTTGFVINVAAPFTASANIAYHCLAL